jgi:hypothetical protein
LFFLLKVADAGQQKCAKLAKLENLPSCLTSSVVPINFVSSQYPASKRWAQHKLCGALHLLQPVRFYAAGGAFQFMTFYSSKEALIGVKEFYL